MKIGLGSTKRFKVSESLGGTPVTSPLPANWSVDSGSPFALAPVGGGNPSLECDVTAGAFTGTGTLTASIPGGGPSGSLALEAVFPVDAVTIVEE